MDNEWPLTGHNIYNLHPTNQAFAILGFNNVDNIGLLFIIHLIHLLCGFWALWIRRSIAIQFVTYTLYLTLYTWIIIQQFDIAHSEQNRHIFKWLNDSNLAQTTQSSHLILLTHCQSHFFRSVCGKFAWLILIMFTFINDLSSYGETANARHTG